MQKDKLTTPVLDISTLVHECLEFEKTRDLSQRSLDELERHLHALARHCAKAGLQSLTDLTPAFLKDFVQGYHSPSMVKAVVWAVRKFGEYLALLQHLAHNPAEALQHPKISRRAKLPEYLTPTQLRTLLETAVQNRSLSDVTILSLLVTAGLRPHEVALLRRKDIDIIHQTIYVHVKGGWLKRTLISSVMTDILSDYLDQYPQQQDILFRNAWGNPIDKRWVLRLVKAAGKDAAITCTLTPRILRHTFATYLADRHGKQVTKAALGHRANHTTDVYMHLIPSKYRKYANMHPYQTVIARRRYS